ncbi:Mrpl33 mitochondrial ribosomal protein of the large subunit [Candida orthopsilosis Co 90-125]|uniref:Large ribosomal subunit protein uL30m n=1 Tax=Candida orthopsilosis (strain 90-125) TaxID=1136231 RepID=H8X197_CANO9|nr:Mrpl33 mitochondrial ribosomal protein of the large subunit [Candida orthopsilosis Co 90-125]CCG22137.1 Mrpl33 mitochondrial ribosomal protein of the large subunit [Candida orthopsilosis Co 90-125]
MSSSRQLYYKVTQIRSSIGMPPTTRRTLEALGLKRRNQTIYAKCDVSSAHSLAKVKELVKIEVTDQKKTREEINQERKWKSGFEVIPEGTRKVYN